MRPRNIVASVCMSETDYFFLGPEFNSLSHNIWKHNGITSKNGVVTSPRTLKLIKIRGRGRLPLGRDKLQDIEEVAMGPSGLE